MLGKRFAVSHLLGIIERLTRTQTGELGDMQVPIIAVDPSATGGAGGAGKAGVSADDGGRFMAMSDSVLESPNPHTSTRAGHTSFFSMDSPCATPESQESDLNEGDTVLQSGASCSNVRLSRGRQGRGAQRGCTPVGLLQRLHQQGKLSTSPSGKSLSQLAFSCQEGVLSPTGESFVRGH
jgi:hypothetical protein